MVGLPHRFADRSAVADVLAAHEDLEPGASSGCATGSPGACSAGAAWARRRSSTSRTAPADPADGVGEWPRRRLRDADGRDARRHRRGLGRGDSQPPRRALAAARLVRAARAQPAAAARPLPRARRRRDPLPPALPRPARQPRRARRVPAARASDHGAAPRARRGRASSRSRRRPCNRSTAGRTRGRSRRTTTSWIATSTCGSRPSCT